MRRMRTSGRRLGFLTGTGTGIFSYLILCYHIISYHYILSWGRVSFLILFFVIISYHIIISYHGDGYLFISYNIMDMGTTIPFINQYWFN